MASNGRILRIYLDEQARHKSKPLYEAVIDAAREAGLAGATVLRGIEGYGSHGEIHKTKILRLSENLPVVIEIAETAEKIAAFLPVLKEIAASGVATITDAEVVPLRRSSQAKSE